MPEYLPSLTKIRQRSAAQRHASREHCHMRPKMGRKKENAMKQSLTLLGLGAALLLSQVARADEIDWKKVDAALGKPPR